MSVYLTSAYPFSEQTNFAPQWLVEHASEEGRKFLAESPEAADAILFVEAHPGEDPYLMRVHHSALNREFPQKCVLYHDADYTVTRMRTISPSVWRWQFDHRFNRSVHYVARLCPNAVLDAASAPLPDSFRYLYSFMGSVRTHKIRKSVLELPSDDAFLLDTSGMNAWEMSLEERQAFQSRFLDVMVDSLFVLCPRGVGPSSYRLFETMQIGRVPVIIADEWMAPDFVDWSSCSIRVAEADVASIPEILRVHRDSGRELARNAQEVWRKYFSPEASLETLAKAALEVVTSPLSTLDSLKMSLGFARSPHTRGLLRYYKNRARQFLSSSAR